MYQIGEFSRITRLTVKTLRYYDQEGILSPSGRGENGYRLYSGGDFEKAQVVVLLRELGFSVSELRDAAGRCQDPGELRAVLTEKRSLLARELREGQRRMREIDRRLTLLKKVELRMQDYKFEIRELPAVRAAALRARVPYGEIGGQMGKLYKAVKGGGDGAPFNLYYDGAHAEPADMETCVPLKPEARPKGVTVRTIPACRALCTLHVGPYDTLNLAYKALLDYAAAHGLRLRTPSREVYRKGPGMVFKGDPDRYETEIAVPLE